MENQLINQPTYHTHESLPPPIAQPLPPTVDEEGKTGRGGNKGKESEDIGILTEGVTQRFGGHREIW